MGFPGSSAGRTHQQHRRLQFNFWVAKIPWRKDRLHTPVFLGFPGGSDGKESTCDVGDLSWEDPLEEGMATYSNILAWGVPMDRGAWGATVHGSQRGTTE